MTIISRVTMLLVIVALLAACGVAAAPTPATQAGGKAANGDKLFHQATLGKDNVPGCASCHSTEADNTVVGPTLADIATDAGGAYKEAGYKGTAKDAAGWLKEQIVNPELETVEGFQPGVMPKNYGTELSDQEMNDIVAYLLTLK